MISIIFKALRKIKYYLIPFFSTFICKIYLKLNDVKFDSISSYGLPYIHVSLNGYFKIGKNFTMNNLISMCESGLNGKCRIEVLNGATLIIGDSVGISAVTISCFNKITIKDYVKIGVGVHIYDTDFHSLNPILRRSKKSDIQNINSKQIIIENNVFIGAHSLILKGIVIGENSIIGAGSVVTKSIPADEIWAGNPAKFIRVVERK